MLRFMARMDTTRPIDMDRRYRLSDLCIYVGNIYLLLAECKVCMASYGLSFFLPFMARA